MTARRHPFTTVVTVLSLVFLVSPLVLMVLFSFHSTAAVTLPFDGFSLRWYRSALSNPQFQDALKYSLQCAGAVALLTLVLGTLTAYGLSRSVSRSRGSLNLLFFLPFTVPGLFVGVSLAVFFQRLGVDRSFLTVVIGQWIFVFPFFILLVRQAFERLDPALEEAAADLGAGPLQQFFRVTLPAIWPVLLAATALSFAFAFEEFPITYFTIGSNSTLPIYVFSKLDQVVDPEVNVVATTLMAITLSLFALVLAAVLINQRLRARGIVERGVE